MNFETGQPVPRTEDPRLLIGGGRYTDDLTLGHQASMFVLRSPHAHAEIRSIDKTAAEAMPGVLAVLTGEDYAADGLGQIGGPSPRQRRDGSPMFRPHRPALTRDRVRHVGQAVALVIAKTLAQAKDAAEAVAVDYAPRPIVMSTATANQPGQPAIWDECPDNECFFYEAGDKAATDAAIAGAAYVVRQKFVITRLTANAMEPRVAIGHYDRGEGRYTMYAPHQRPYAWRTVLAKQLFHVDENKISLIPGDVGGSFGMKGAIYPEIPLAAWASKRVGRPVKWTCERSEAYMADDHGRDNITEAELALDENGKFLGMRVLTQASLGAYVSYLGAGPSTGNIGSLAGVYTIPAMYCGVTGVFTNMSPISPYRGAGRPEAAYIIERMVTLAARHMGLDVAEIRRRNFIPPDAMPYKTALTFTYDSGDFDGVMSDALELADYGGAVARRKDAEARGKLFGIGTSMTIEQSAAPQTETAEMRFDPSGTLTLLVGTTPHGQGHETIYKQLICEKLGLDPERIRIIEGDTEKVSFGTGTGGSRTATLGTSAVFEAVNKVIDKTTKLAAHMLEAAEADVTLEDGAFKIAGTDKQVGFTEVAAAAFVPAKLPAGMEPGLYETATYNPTKANYPNGCHVVEVEIDPDTGVVELTRYTEVGDVGTELNPLLVKGQIMGGIAQGAGQALMEEIKYDEETGQLLSGSFLDYAMPRADDFCGFTLGSHPVPTATNPLGVKGAGEAGTVGALPAVMNAVNDALASVGVEHFDMPATPERVWRAIRAARG